MLAWALTLALFAGASASSSRIIGGETTSVENFPSIVQLENKNLDTGFWRYRCGGSIITSRHILSSGHCLYTGYIDRRLQRIRAGATYRTVGGVIHYLDNVIIHPGNLRNSFVDNIAVARLATSLVFTPTVQRTAIPPQGTVIPDNLPVKQAGWGMYEENSDYSEVLRYVDVLTVNFEVCSARYRPVTDWHALGRDLICSGLLDVGKGSCFGDYGGPLLYGNVTIGIIHGHEDCGSGKYPSLNTNVSMFSDWIIANAVYEGESKSS